MWQLFTIISFHFLNVQTAWVEIPQILDKPSEIQALKRPTKFVLGAPKVSFVDQETTTPLNYRMLTTLASYKHVMTSTTISPLTKMPTPTEVPEETSSHSSNFSKSEESEGTYSGFLPLLRNIQQTLTANARKSLKSKITLLSNLRDNLLSNIDERISSMWKRSEDITEARGHDDHDMDFPSNEGALMTIGFLTFAVFLIKLVLKLIHALKYKGNGNPMVVTTATPTVYIGRKKRAVEDDEKLKILRLIDEYNFK